MSDIVIVALIMAAPPTLGTAAVLWRQHLDRKERRRDKAEAIAARVALDLKVSSVQTLVNGTSHETKAEIIALKKEVARLNREPGEPTPTIEAGTGAPGEVGQDHGVITAEREGPFPPKSGSRE